MFDICANNILERIMILLDEFDVLVIVGGWNKHIFSRDWVSRYLLPNETQEVEIPVNVDGSPRISSEKVRVAVLGNRLSFTSRKSNDEVLEFVQGLGLKTADYLPHTGLNESEPEIGMVKLL
jgi:hypothetical protein